MSLKKRSIMVQGTASTVGKSILCTALCRIFTQDGYNVNPFKAQNMSLNSGITFEGGEIGRAQVIQAEAARKAPTVKMNPILLKPTSDTKSQVIIDGKVYANMDAVDYFKFKPTLKYKVTEIYNQLKDVSDLVVIEGAGSPAEINLNHDDFVNMGMAKIAESPVIIVGDIDKGGVFAALAGTMLLLSEEERKLVKGVIINKFRGSYEILEPGLRMLEDIIKVPVLGVVPYFDLNIEDEDSVTEWGKFTRNPNADIDIAVIALPYMSNFTDFNALTLYKDVNLRFVHNVEQLAQPDIIILPGSKSTIGDLNYLKDEGLAEKIISCHKQGAYILGICGGFQMLGKTIIDANEAETAWQFTEGLRLLEVVTKYKEEKTTAICEGEDSTFRTSIKGYEIHMGETHILNQTGNFATINKRNNINTQISDGAVSEDERVFGTYIHGIFDNSKFTRSFINKVRVAKGMKPWHEMPTDYWDYKDEQYDKLAQLVRDNLDINKIKDIIKVGNEGN